MAPKAPPLPGAAAATPATPAITTTIGPGDVKILHLKPPIVVRDFAVALGLKPFKLISELNQLVGFAAMNSTIVGATVKSPAPSRKPMPAVPRSTSRISEPVLRWT